MPFHGALRLPYRGTCFEVPAATIAAGWDVVLLEEQDFDDPNLRSLVLGTALEQMDAARVPDDYIRRAARAAVAMIAGGLEYAERTWNVDEDGIPLDDAPPMEGLEALDQYGQGERDPLTGLYEFYADLPASAGAIHEDGGGESVSWAKLAEVLDVVEYCFHADLGIDLAAVWDTASWRWFAVRLRGLLASETLLAAQFRTDEPTPRDQGE